MIEAPAPTVSAEKGTLCAPPPRSGRKVRVKPFGERLAKQAAPEAGNSDPKQRALGEMVIESLSSVTSHWSVEKPVTDDQ